MRFIPKLNDCLFSRYCQLKWLGVMEATGEELKSVLNYNNRSSVYYCLGKLHNYGLITYESTVRYCNIYWIRDRLNEKPVEVEKWSFITPDGKIIRSSIGEFGKIQIKYGLRNGTLMNLVEGKLKSYKGWRLN